MGRHAHRLALGASVVLVGLAGWQALRSLRDGRSSIDFLYNADFLAPATLYQDVVVDGYSPRSYRFSGHTFAVPDLVAYFAVRSVVGQTAPSVLIWEAVLFIVTLACWSAAAALLLSRAARPYFGPLGLCSFAIYLGVNSLSFFQTSSRDLLLPVWHNGALALAFAGLALTVAFLRSVTLRGRLLWLTGLVVLSAAGMFSDRLFGLYFAAPVASALFLVRLVAGPNPCERLQVNWEKWLSITLAIAMGGILGLAALRAVQPKIDDPLEQYWTGVELEGIEERIGYLAEMLEHEARCWNVLVLGAFWWYLLCTARVLLFAYRRTFGLSGPIAGSVSLTYYQAFSVLMAIGVVAVLLVSRVSAELMFMRQWNDFSRYLVGPLGAACLGWPIWLASLAGRGHRPLSSAIMIAVFGLASVVVGIGLASERACDHDLSAYQPGYVKALDEVAVSYGLQDGVTWFWTAKPVTLLSQTGIKARPVTHEPTSPFGFVPSHWLSTSEVFWRNPRDLGPVRYQFVVAADPAEHPAELPAETVVAALGEPAERIALDGRVMLLLYNRESDDRFRRFGELDYGVQNLRYALNPADPIRYPGNGLDHSAGRPNHSGDARVAEEGRLPVCALTCGPYLRPRLTGPHRVTFRITASGSGTVPNGFADVYLTDARRRSGTKLEEQTIPAGFDSELPLEIDVTEAMLDMRLEFRVTYAGVGRLVVHWVQFEPILGRIPSGP